MSYLILHCSRVDAKTATKMAVDFISEVFHKEKVNIDPPSAVKAQMRPESGKCMIFIIFSKEPLILKML